MNLTCAEEPHQHGQMLHRNIPLQTTEAEFIVLAKNQVKTRLWIVRIHI